MSPKKKTNTTDSSRVIDSKEIIDNSTIGSGNLADTRANIYVDNDGVEVLNGSDGEVSTSSPIKSNVVVAIDHVVAEEVPGIDVQEPTKQDEPRTQVRRLNAPKSENKLNKFDNFFVKLWSYIVSAVFGIASGINFVISKIFKKKAPDRYVRAFVAIVLIVSMVLLFALPFRINVSQDVQVEIYGDGLVAVKTRVYEDDKGYPVYKWGYANKKGKMVIQPIYEEASHFTHGVAWVKYNERKDVDGVEVIDSYWHLIDKRGKRKGDLKFHNAVELGKDIRPVGNFSKEVKLAWVYLSGFYGYINTSGNVKISHKFQYAEDFNEGLARVRVGTTEYYINAKGKKIGDENYDEVKTFTGGLGAVKTYGTWGFVNAKGKMIIEPTYDDVSSFEGEYAAVRKDTTYAIIDKKGKYIVRPLEYVDINTVSPEFKKLIDSLQK